MKAQVTDPPSPEVASSSIANSASQIPPHGVIPPPIQSQFEFGKYYWFHLHERYRPLHRSRKTHHHEILAGHITRITHNLVEWRWSFDPDRTATRRISTLLAQQTRLLSPKELDILVHRDHGYTFADVTTILEQEQCSQEPVLFSPLQYSLSGFQETQDADRWNRLLLDWLPTFDPRVFLIRHINSEAPTGSAKALWTQCVKALTNLLRQTEITDDAGHITSTDAYDQLTMIARCLPILLLRVPRYATHNTKQQIVRHNCRLFLRGSWPSLSLKAQRELEELDTINRTGPSMVSREQTILHRVRSLQLSRAMGLLR